MLKILWSKLKPGSFSISTTLEWYKGTLQKHCFFLVLLKLLTFVCHFSRKIQNISLVSASLFLCSLIHTVVRLYKLSISLSSDTENNLGPPWHDQNKSFSICNWKLNSITAYSYAKVSLLKTHITALTMDITYLLDPSLDSNIKLDENNLDKPGYTLVLSDYPSNNKHGSVYK